ncbi:phosphate ABC transporter permease subunit PstC [Eubacteriaceae bacterium ES3]|nr:phosphate ABC transporter permease subunit PstC [Eubacteriaceae bacterium ES3]
MEETKVSKFRERVIESFFLICAFVAVISVLAITFYVFYNGLAPFVSGSYPIWDFISGVEWRPGNNQYGVFYMIVGSIFATFGAILIGVPIAILTAVFISQMAKGWAGKIIRFAVELLAGIPSVLYGIFGLGIIVPYVLKISPMAQGESLLATILVLTIMILPTVVSISETSISAVPREYKEGSLALGATEMQTIFKVIIPAGKSGIITGVILGIGRAIGETMAVMLVCGNPIAGIPTSLFDQVRPLTTNIALEMGYASGVHQQLLYSTGVVLFVFIMIINVVVNRVVKSKVGS